MRSLLVSMTVAWMVASAIDDVELEKSVTELMNNMMQKQDMNVNDKCQQVYTFCREVGKIIGKPLGTEGEYCLLKNECASYWKEGNLIGLSGKIVSGYSKMLVGLSPEMEDDIMLKIKRCC